MFPESKKATTVAETEQTKIAEVRNTIRNTGVGVGGGSVSGEFGGWLSVIDTLYLNINMTISLAMLRMYLAG